jgi:uncharacterized integral membrane protein
VNDSTSDAERSTANVQPTNDRGSNDPDQVAHEHGGRSSAPGRERVRHTRTSAAWVGVVVVVLLGVALVDFIAQNTRDVHVEFFGFDGQMPLAVAMLAAALAGALIVLAVGVGRVAQLRLGMRRQRRRHESEHASPVISRSEESDRDPPPGAPS